MSRTFDEVLVGSADAVRAPALEALGRGRSVLVVLGAGDAAAGRRLRRVFRKDLGCLAGRVCVTTGAEVVCAAGLRELEAVVIRYTRSRRLLAVNASALQCCDVPPTVTLGSM